MTSWSNPGRVDWLPLFDSDGRTFAGADASSLKFVVFMSFFLKPMSVTLPFADRFTDGETASRARERIQQFSESENRDSGGKGRRRRWRCFCCRFHYRLAVGPVSSKWEVMACVKMAKKTTCNSSPAGFFRSISAPAGGIGGGDAQAQAPTKSIIRAGHGSSAKSGRSGEQIRHLRKRMFMQLSVAQKKPRKNNSETSTAG